MHRSLLICPKSNVEALHTLNHTSKLILLLYMLECDISNHVNQTRDPNTSTIIMCITIIISQCVGRSKKPPDNYNISLPRNLKITVLTLLITKLTPRSITSEQALWEINKLYLIHLYGILVINTRPRIPCSFWGIINT